MWIFCFLLLCLFVGLQVLNIRLLDRQEAKDKLLQQPQNIRGNACSLDLNNSLPSESHNIGQLHPCKR